MSTSSLPEPRRSVEESDIAATAPAVDRAAIAGARRDAAMDDVAVRTSLSCGTDPDVLLHQVAEGRGDERDAHQAGCPHCQATLEEYLRLWAPIDELAATPTPAPASVVDRALAGIRQQAGPVGWGRVTDDGGSFLVAARAVIAVAGHAARTTAGVRMALSALGAADGDPADGDGRAVSDGDASEVSGVSIADVSAGVAGQSVAVDLRVAADYGRDLTALAGQLRERVVAEVRARTGLEVVEVDVTVTDVFASRPA